jgi:hypothetical protein
VLFVYTFLSLPIARAANLTNSSITLGSSLASEVTSHNFRFTTTTSGSVGSDVFEYCYNLPFYGSSCSAPAGLNVSAASISTQSGMTGFSVSGVTTSNRLVLTRAASLATNGVVVLNFNNITNQSAVSQSVFVRISVHSSTDGTGAPLDNAAVVYSTVPGVGVGGYVPPYLTFCVGVTVATDCSSATGALLNLGELSTKTAKFATSQFAVATNDPTGYLLYVSGGTMTAGNEIIPGLSSGGTSQVGTSQFGINLRSNSNPVVGSEVSGVGTGVPVTGYGTSNNYKYNNGDLIARSPLPTEFNRFTVSYLVNISEDQRPGIYASSFTYIALASF